MDTLYLAGLFDEFESVVHQISGGIMHSSPPTSIVYSIKTFEYHIRIVGGLLGAYTVSGRRELLLQATEAADCVLATFDTHTGLPRMYGRIANPSVSPVLSWIAKTVDAISAKVDKGASCNTLSGIGSFGLELRAISRETGNPKYKQAAERIERFIYDQWKSRKEKTGFQHKYWNIMPQYRNDTFDFIGSCHWAQSEIAFGSGGDSFYEYLLKEQIIEPDGTEFLKEMYNAFVSTVEDRSATKDKKVVYVSNDKRRTLVHIFLENVAPHLVCFGGGLLALGAHHFEDHKVDMELAKEVGEQCVKFYETPTGLAADVTAIMPDGTTKPYTKHVGYQLRPETVETLFVLFQTTGDDKYREMGWKIFEAIEKHCKIQSGGYSGVRDVLQIPIDHDNHMPSYFLAETLKYLLLLFEGNASLSLNEYVFTTEGHPITIDSTCKYREREGLPRCSGQMTRQYYWESKWDVVGLSILTIGGIVIARRGRKVESEGFKAD
jgi:mannosyl-oligosaccharide alpha-1,2-mannosidase